MDLIAVLLRAWPILLVMVFLIWARVTATRLQTDPAKGPVTLILLWVLFLNLSPTPWPVIWYLLCLPFMLQVIWQLWQQARFKELPPEQQKQASDSASTDE